MTDNIHPFPSNKKTAKPDKSNVVSASSDLFNTDIETKFLSLWTKHKKHVFYGFLFMCGGLFTYTIHYFYANHKLAAQQEAFLKLSSLDERKSFVRHYGHTELSALVMMQIAEECYDHQQYEEAANYFKQAGEILEKFPLLCGRAQLGYGISTILSGNIENGKKVLEKLCQNKDALETIKAEATYHLAVLDANDKNYKSCRTRLSALSAMPYAGIFAQKANILKDSIPELK